MSAIVAVAGGKLAHILTDAALARQRDGVLKGIYRKQMVAGRVMIAGGGLPEPMRHLARLVEERAPDYDKLTPLAPALWEEVRANLPPAAKDIPFSLIIAGWSEESDRPAMDVLTDAGNVEDVGAWCAGPAEECKAEQKAFIERFNADPDSFDVHRDGVALIERWRRECPRTYDDGKHTAIGGYIQHATITREGISSSILRHWPDIINRCIDPDAPDDPDARDDNWPGQTLAQIFKIREWLVAGGFNSAPPREPAAEHSEAA